MANVMSRNEKWCGMAMPSTNITIRVVPSKHCYGNPALFRLKHHIEQLVGHPFNSCLANLYENGSQAVGWHSDDEPSLRSPQQENVVIASLSFGATRQVLL